MKKDDVFKKLAEHLLSLGMGYPPGEFLDLILRDNFTPLEAEVALAIPNRIIPLQTVPIEEIAKSTDLTKDDLEKTLENLVQKGLIYAGLTEDGQKGYALQQVGFGFPQSFFWGNEDTDQLRDLSYKVARYFNTATTKEAYGPTPTKAFRFVPVKESIEFDLQSVYPYQIMDNVIEKAKVIALAHCACRVGARLAGGGCDCPTEVCMKFDEMAEYVLNRGLGKEISKDEAMDVIKLSQDNNLVHFVDNAIGDVKHNCNCCGHSCWSVTRIRKRKIPRDLIMATYFIRETEEGNCTGCGDCIDVCPVEALSLEDGMAKVEEDWCIGCGICISKCSFDASRMIVRPDKEDEIPASSFKTLHEQILKERGLKLSKPDI